MRLHSLPNSSHYSLLRHPLRRLPSLPKLPTFKSFDNEQLPLSNNKKRLLFKAVANKKQKVFKIDTTSEFKHKFQTFKPSSTALKKRVLKKKKFHPSKQQTQAPPQYLNNRGNKRNEFLLTHAYTLSVDNRDKSFLIQDELHYCVNKINKLQSLLQNVCSKIEQRYQPSQNANSKVVKKMEKEFNRQNQLTSLQYLTSEKQSMRVSHIVGENCFRQQKGPYLCSLENAQSLNQLSFLPPEEKAFNKNHSHMVKKSVVFQERVYSNQQEENGQEIGKDKEQGLNSVQSLFQQQNLSKSQLEIKQTENSEIIQGNHKTFDKEMNSDIYREESKNTQFITEHRNVYYPIRTYTLQEWKMKEQERSKNRPYCTRSCGQKCLCLLDKMAQ